MCMFVLARRAHTGMSRFALRRSFVFPGFRCTFLWSTATWKLICDCVIHVNRLLTVYRYSCMSNTFHVCLWAQPVLMASIMLEFHNDVDPTTMITLELGDIDIWASVLPVLSDCFIFWAVHNSDGCQFSENQNTTFSDDWGLSACCCLNMCLIQTTKENT